MRANSRRTAVIIAAILVCATSSFALAKNFVPFKGSVVATWDNVYAALPPVAGGNSLATFNGTSQMTHMGRAAQSGTLTLTPNGNPLIPGNGSVTITAANGDTVSFDYNGFLNPQTGEGTGKFNITGGTGRFLGATGQGTFYAVIDLSRPKDQPMTVELNGMIKF